MGLPAVRGAAPNFPLRQGGSASRGEPSHTRGARNRPREARRRGQRTPPAPGHRGRRRRRASVPPARRSAIGGLAMAFRIDVQCVAEHEARPTAVPSVVPPASLSSCCRSLFSGSAPRAIKTARHCLLPGTAPSSGNPARPASAGAEGCAASAHCPTRRQPERGAAPHLIGAHCGTRRQPGRRPTGASPTAALVGHRGSASPVLR